MPPSVLTDRLPVLRNRFQFLLGFFMLLLGSLIYLTERAPEAVYFTRFFDLQDLREGGPLLGVLGPRLPAFFHTLAFSLLTAAFLPSGPGVQAGICGGWFLANLVFELGQKFKDEAARLTPDILTTLPFFESTRAYFINGTFDGLDIAAAFAGAVMAWGIMRLTNSHHL